MPKDTPSCSLLFDSHVCLLLSCVELEELTGLKLCPLTPSSSSLLGPKTLKPTQRSTIGMDKFISIPEGYQSLEFNVTETDHKEALGLD